MMNTPDCRTCGACCSGLVVEVDTVADDVPDTLVKHDLLWGLVMRGRRKCIALSGEVGRRVRCRIYENRPRVCRQFEPGSPMCMESRARMGVLDIQARFAALRAAGTVHS